MPPGASPQSIAVLPSLLEHLQACSKLLCHQCPLLGHQNCNQMDTLVQRADRARPCCHITRGTLVVQLRGFPLFCSSEQSPDPPPPRGPHQGASLQAERKKQGTRLASASRSSQAAAFSSGGASLLQAVLRSSSSKVVSPGRAKTVLPSHRCSRTESTRKMDLHRPRMRSAAGNVDSVVEEDVAASWIHATEVASGHRYGTEPLRTSLRSDVHQAVPYLLSSSCHGRTNLTADAMLPLNSSASCV